MPILFCEKRKAGMGHLHQRIQEGCRPKVETPYIGKPVRGRNSPKRASFRLGARMVPLRIFPRAAYNRAGNFHSVRVSFCQNHLLPTGNLPSRSFLLTSNRDRYPDLISADGGRFYSRCLLGGPGRHFQPFRGKFSTSFYSGRSSPPR